MTADWAIAGDLTMEHAESTRKALRDLLHGDRSPVVIDCAAVDKIDSVGLVALVSFVRTLAVERQGVEVHLLAVGSMLRKMITMTRLESAFPQLVIAERA